MNRPDREQRKTSKGRSSVGDRPTGGDRTRSGPQPIADLEFLRGLIEAVDDSGIDSLEISRGGTRIRIAKSPGAGALVTHSGGGGTGEPASPPVTSFSPSPAPIAPTLPAPVPAEEEPAAALANNWIEIKSPMVGTFYRAPSPEAPPYVEVGSRVVKGQTLCVLEAMKLMNELEADVAGIIREVAVENGEPVEYGQVLYRVEPEA